MPFHGGYSGNFGDTHEGFILLFGFIALLTGAFFFLQRAGILTFAFAANITDENYLLFFAGIAVVSGILQILSTVGFLKTR